jgi:hypothetical protein
MTTPPTGRSPMRRSLSVLMLSVGLLVLTGSPASRAATCSLATLAWMAGTWRNSENPDGAQERWVVAPGQVLMGSSWEFPPGKSGYAEIMTIRPDGADVAMILRHFDGGLAHAREERATPMVFTASDCTAQSVLFSGQGAQAGEQMRYTRSADALLIAADFLHHGTPQHIEWHMKRSGD